MSVSYRPLAPNSSLSRSLVLFLSVNPCILQSSLLFSLSVPRVLHVKNINFVLYGWLEGRSKFLLFSTPSLSLSLAFSLRTHPTIGFLKATNMCTQKHTHKPAVVPCVTCLIRGNQGRLWLSWRLKYFLLSFSLLSIFLSFFVTLPTSHKNPWHWPWECSISVKQSILRDLFALNKMYCRFCW